MVQRTNSLRNAAKDEPATPEADRPDALLVEQVGSGDRKALAQLYERHAGRLLGCAWRILHNRSDAEDLIHDLFIEVWQRAGSFDPGRGSVFNWLMLRLRSRAIDRLRVLSTARRRALVSAVPDEQPAPPASDPSLCTDNALTRKRVCALSEVQRTVLELIYFEGLTCAEIATRCHVPIGTVKSRLSAALRSLRQYHANHGDSRNAQRY